jgi:hypothetical protein
MSAERPSFEAIVVGTLQPEGRSADHVADIDRLRLQEHSLGAAVSHHMLSDLAAAFYDVRRKDRGHPSPDLQDRLDRATIVLYASIAPQALLHAEEHLQEGTSSPFTEIADDADAQRMDIATTLALDPVIDVDEFRKRFSTTPSYTVPLEITKEGPLAVIDHVTEVTIAGLQTLAQNLDPTDASTQRMLTLAQVSCAVSQQQFRQLYTQAQQPL